jgi:hypothetical protein
MSLAAMIAPMSASQTIEHLRAAGEEQRPPPETVGREQGEVNVAAEETMTRTMVERRDALSPMPMLRSNTGA